MDRISHGIPVFSPILLLKMGITSTIYVSAMDHAPV